MSQPEQGTRCLLKRKELIELIESYFLDPTNSKTDAQLLAIIFGTYDKPVPKKFESLIPKRSVLDANRCIKFPSPPAKTKEATQDTGASKSSTPAKKPAKKAESNPSDDKNQPSGNAPAAKKPKTKGRSTETTKAVPKDTTKPISTKEQIKLSVDAKLLYPRADVPRFTDMFKGTTLPRVTFLNGLPKIDKEIFSSLVTSRIRAIKTKIGLKRLHKSTVAEIISQVNQSISVEMSLRKTKPASKNTSKSSPPQLKPKAKVEFVPATKQESEAKRPSPTKKEKAKAQPESSSSQPKNTGPEAERSRLYRRLLVYRAARAESDSVYARAKIIVHSSIEPLHPNLLFRTGKVYPAKTRNVDQLGANSFIQENGQGVMTPVYSEGSQVDVKFCECHYKIAPNLKASFQRCEIHKDSKQYKVRRLSESEHMTINDPTVWVPALWQKHHLSDNKAMEKAINELELQTNFGVLEAIESSEW